MPTIQQTDQVHIQAAHLYAELSKSKKLKVGAVLVTEHGVMIPGYNGDYSGGPNIIEDWNEESESYVTRPTTIHAELNCILKAAKEGVSVQGSTVYITHSPCAQCASMLLTAGVNRVVYSTAYRDTEGTELLINHNVEVECLS